MVRIQKIRPAGKLQKKIERPFTRPGANFPVSPQRFQKTTTAYLGPLSLGDKCPRNPHHDCYFPPSDKVKKDRTMLALASLHMLRRQNQL